MRFVLRASLVALALVACGYDFGGGSDTSTSGSGGDDGATTTSKTTTTTTATTSTTATTDTSTADTSSTTDGSSSTGIEDPMGRCLEEGGNGVVFKNDFSAAGMWDPFVTVPSNDFVAAIQNGQVELALDPAVSNQLTVGMKSFARFVFDECSIEIQQVDPSGRVDELVLTQDLGGYLSVYSASGNVWLANDVTGTLGFVDHQPWVRLTAMGTTVMVESSADGITYDRQVMFPRPAGLGAPSTPLHLSLQLGRSGTDPDMKMAWDNLNTNP